MDTPKHAEFARANTDVTLDWESSESDDKSQDDFWESESPKRGQGSKVFASTPKIKFHNLNVVNQITNKDLPPRNALRQPFWTLQTIKRTTAGRGEFISRRVFCPSHVWAQNGAVIPGLGVKVKAWENTIAILKQVENAAKPIEKNPIPFTTILLSALSDLDHVRSSLSKTFSSIPKSLTQKRAALEKKQEYLQKQALEKLNNPFGSLWKDVSSMTQTAFKNTKKSIEQLQKPKPHRVSALQLQRYAQLVVHLADSCAALETLWAFTKDWKSQGADQLHAGLDALSFFVQDTVCHLLLADLQILLTLYIENNAKLLVWNGVL